ncbi:MAG: hypothetical protein U0Q16_16065 [Bryobacteraceae bacterium]
MVEAQLAASASINNTSVISGINSGTLGLADHGTRLIVRFANVQNGLALWVGNNGTVYTPQGIQPPDRYGQPRAATDPNGAGPFSATPAGTSVNGGIEISVIGGTGQATWEIINADTTAVERRVEIRSWLPTRRTRQPALAASARPPATAVWVRSARYSPAPRPRCLASSTPASAATC